MKNNTFKKWFALSALFVFMCFSPHGLLRAQSTANYAFSTNTTGSLGLDMNGNTVDMSTGTTQLVAADLDDASSAVTGIGFNFFLYGSNFTQFSANSNGLIQLGATAVGNTTYLASGGSIASPRIGALVADLRTGIAGKVHYKLVGTAPNRCLVVEFLNMSITYVGTPGSNDGTYQVRLYETSGVVEFVYGSMFKNNSTTTSAAINSGFSVNTTANTLASITTSSNTVSYATFNLNSYTNATNIPNLHSTAEGSRRVYQFTPPVPNAPSALTFSSVLTGSMGLNWTDNSSNEVAFALYNSLDGITYNYYGSLPANSTSTTATGLSANTLYYWRVYAVSEGALSSPALSGSQSTLAASPISGVKTVGSGGDYSNLTIAFSEINANMLSGNMDLQLISGYPAVAETYPIQSSNTASVGAFNVKVYPTVSGLSITSNNTTGTLNLNNAKNITFDGRVNQAGANDLIISNTNAGTSYAILLNNDASNNTIQNCIVQSTNTSTTSGTIVFGTTTGANGNDNNSISACDIRDGATNPLNAIYSVGTTTTAAQFNDNNTITGNNISNFFSAGSSTIGVFVGGGNSTWTISNNKLFQTATRTYTSGNTHNGIQVNNTNGNGFVITGNTIGFASSTGTGTYTMAGTIATRFIGINISAGTTAASSVQGNTISNFSLTTSSGASTGNGIFAGINVTGGNVNVGTVTANTIGSGTGTGSIVATTSTAGGLIVGINSSSAGTVNITGNAIGSINGLGSTATAPASITGIQVSGGTPTISNNTIGSTVTANSINAITVATSGAQLVRGIDVTSGVTLATSIQSNTISNLTQSGTTTGGSIRGIAYAGTGVATISLNTVSVLTGANANTSIAGTGIQGILYTGSSTGGTISGNTIQTLISSNTGAVQSNVNGIGISGLSAAVVSTNKIYNLQNASTGVTTTTPPTVSGIMVRSIGTGSNISNNMVSLGNAQTTNTEFIGVWNSATSASAINIYNNSINVEGTVSAGALPSFAFLRGDNSGTAVTSIVDVRNNIFNSTRSGGTGKHYAIANQSTAPSATGWGLNASNFNILNTANTATVGLWGSTDATFNAWRVAASSDANSFSALPVVFVNTATGDLHLNMGVTATPIESGGATIAAVTMDFDTQSRPGPAGSVNGGGTSPDLGADEFDGVPALPVITINSVTPPAAAQCATAPRLVSVNITTPVGTIVSANLGYSINGTPQTAIAMTNVSGTTWTATIPASSPANATIAWAVSATNSSALSSSINGTTYSDEPLTGVTASVLTSASPICAGDPATLTASLIKPVIAVSGSGGSTSTSSSVSPFYHGYGGVKTQYIFRVSELTAMGLTAGNITALSLNVSTLGTPGLGSFTINMGHTAQNAAVANTAIVSGLTPVFSAVTQTLVSGTNTFTFSAPFNWNGTSNIVISFCYSNNNTGGTSSAVTTDPTLSFTSSLAIYSDNANATTCLLPAVSSGQACMGTNSNGTSSIRPTITLSGSGAPAIQTVSWSDGVGTVGTTNPLTVSPTTTTTYTATITSVGCTVTPAPTVAVTVNPLPTAPTATNSAQCGTQIPTASVTSTSGLPTPSFKWYDAASAGTVLQNSTSTTYTSNVTATTTFYVAEVNGTTGCESARTPVTITVATADGILASIDNATICIGSSVILTAANTNATPNQSYTYTWTGTAGSGVTSTPGNPITVTPTVPGTYTYTATGVDGGCNAISTVDVTVTPFTSVVTPINITCNGYNNGSFSQGAVSCGTAASYSVDGGTFGPIPTNLTPGVHAVITMNSAGFTSASQNITITEPSTTIGAPTATNASVCQASSTAPVSATSFTNAPTPQVSVVNFALVGQPTETQAAPGVVISTATLPTLPAGAVITGLTLASNGIVPHGGEYQSDVRLGLSGIFTNTAAQGTGTIGFGTVAETPYNYTRSIPVAGFPTTGGTINVLYWNNVNDVSGADDATFPLGASAITLTIDYTIPTPSTISWWNASTGGAQIGTGSPFETVGTSVLPNANIPGVYTVYAQGEFGGCSGTTRTPVTVTVKATSTSTTSATACNTYTWNGTTYNASGTYTHTLVNSVGCDSIATLNLTINNSSASSTTVTTCDSYTWTNGTTYVASGTYTQTLTNAVGCDSVATLVLTINHSTTGTDVQSSCGAYTWINGVTYVASNNTATHTLTNAAGCDSIVTLNLTINQPNTGTDAQTSCSSYTWNGTTYTSSGTYVQVLTNAAGCDSTVTLTLTINQPSASTVTETECTSFTWAQNGMTYTTSGLYTDTISNAVSCDSVITLDLTIIQPTTSSVSATACTSYTWAQNGTTYNASGAYTDTIPNASGCDSIITLNLTINSFVATATDNGNATATASVGTSYQWINCVTNAPIAGATGQTFVATANGSYAAIVSNGTCSDTTNCVTIANVGIKENTISTISVHPNPTNDYVIVTMDASSATVEVMDVQGKLVQTAQIKSGDQIDLNAYERGVYTLRIKTEFGTSVERIVKN